MLDTLHEIINYEGNAEDILVDLEETNYRVIKKKVRRAAKLTHPDRYIGADV